MDLKTAKEKWKSHVGNGRKKGTETLTFDQYARKIEEAGIEPCQIGNSRDSYHLARYGDVGDYTPESCRFIPHLENLREQKINGGIESARQKKIGRTKFNDASVASQAEKLRGRSVKDYPAMALGRIKAANTIRGRTKETHSGYAITAGKIQKFYSFVSPTGVIHTGFNVEEFRKVHGLNSSGISKLRTGHLKTYRGWKRNPKWDGVSKVLSE